MEIKIKKKFIEEETKVYIAEDDTEFETEKACRIMKIKYYIQ